MKFITGVITGLVVGAGFTYVMCKGVHNDYTEGYKAGKESMKDFVKLP